MKRRSTTEGSDDPQPGCSHFHPEEAVPCSSDGSSVSRNGSSERVSMASSSKRSGEVDVLRVPGPVGAERSSSRVTNWAKSVNAQYPDFIAVHCLNKTPGSGRKLSIFRPRVSEISCTSSKNAIYSWSADSIKSFGQPERQVSGEKTSADSGDIKTSHDSFGRGCDIRSFSSHALPSLSFDWMNSETKLGSNTDCLRFYYPYKRQRSGGTPSVKSGVIGPDLDLPSNTGNPIPEIPDESLQDLSTTDERTPGDVPSIDRSVPLNRFSDSARELPFVDCSDRNPPTVVGSTSRDASSSVEITSRDALSTSEITQRDALSTSELFPGDASSAGETTASEQSSAELVCRRPLREIQVSEINNPFPETERGSEDEDDNSFDEREEAVPDDFEDEYEPDDDGSESEADAEADGEGVDEGDRGYFQLADRTALRPGLFPAPSGVGSSLPNLEGQLNSIEANKENINMPALRPLFEELSGPTNRKRKRKTIRNRDKYRSPAKRRRPMTLRI